LQIAELGLKILEAVKWENNSIRLIDQRRLPEELIYIYCDTIPQLWDAIKLLKVRGAPAIGIAAGYGVLLSAISHKDLPSDQFRQAVLKDIAYLKTSRPTAVNLFWVLHLFEELLKREFSDNQEMIHAIQRLAFAIHDDDRQRCEDMAVHGQKIVDDSTTFLTHCNTGALATGGIGTALGVIYKAHQLGKRVSVFADETRPLLQGSRLTAFELKHAGIPVTVIADNMAAYLMQQGEIDLIVVGADRIAGNGDTANKIGTYNLAVNAFYHDIPFYVVAPLTTFDPNIASGAEIPIEERNPDELRVLNHHNTAPEDVSVYNPAFDITPHELITGIITDKGIIFKPDTKKVSSFYQTHFKEPKLKEFI
jgi:methylthioribose-1-phosphate isomerase